MSGTRDENVSFLPTTEKASDAEYPLEDLSSCYMDEDPEGAGVRSSDEFELDDDLELGDVPLLPAEFDRLHHLGDSESDTVLNPGFAWRDLKRSPLRTFRALLQGPTEPHVYHINPWFPKLQAAPARIFEQLTPQKWMKVTLLLAGLIVWIAVFFSTLKASVGKTVLGYGAPLRLSCHHRLWSNATDCGLNGELCQPFDGDSFAFRCPAGCANAMILEPYYIGEQEVNYRPLVIGGKPFRVDRLNSGIYRGDSSICASAFHAGLIDNSKGGCAILRRKGERDKFQYFAQNGIDSIESLSHFPMSFSLTRQASSSGSTQAKPVECSDIRWSLLSFTAVVTALYSMTMTSAPVFYSVVYFLVWFQVAMASDPPASDFYDLISIAMGRFLPGAFVGFAIYYFVVRRTLDNLEAHLDKTILWLGGCWFGALNTDTFDRLPISRLTPHDIQQQPGAVTALLSIIAFLIFVFFLQAYCFRQEGRLPTMLRLYGIFAIIIIILVAVPGLNLRIHHYIIALLLLPGTSLQTRPSLLFQGILVGLFINGIARWGFDSVLQTPAALLEGGRLGTPPPAITPPELIDQHNLRFTFPDLPSHVDGISVIVNDVQRYQGLKSTQNGNVPDFFWTRKFANEVEYMRFAYLHVNTLGGVWYEDLSSASTWATDGNFYYPI
ncbi:hypothetical protein N7495_000833 [Penicillium taxi]|uniref:uncharacterized protein n=1 Tax=Penicillium taxi TaxID=168475 RepID=UPI00254546D4|nr:uncharacterized protein N7495_000833 [Penicillium taxi]KAJ5908151.1 hypothetical protein N7495_000833 [Penicillium taxi]